MAKSINRLLAELLDVGGDVKIENLDQAPIVFDSDEIINISNNTGVGLQYYETLDSLPISGLTAGDQAYVAANKRMYISNGSGWYNVALINLTPTMSLDQSGTIILSTEGVATTVTITAQDSDNPDAILSYSVESDGNGIGNYTLSQDSSVFTITPLSEDSGATAGTFTLTFKATDNINTATSDLDFSLTFVTAVDSSAETILLMKAAGNGDTNAAITYQNSSDVSTGFTEAGTPQASTFTPYRSGGYSAYLDGSGDYLTVSHSAGFDFGTSDYTVEFWINTPTPGSTAQSIVGTYNNGGSTGWLVQLADVSSSVNIRLWKGGTNIANQDIGSAFSLNTWHHIAVAREGTSLRFFVDGVQQGTDTTNSTSMSYTSDLYIGRLNHNSEFQYTNGYIRDLRIVKGTAVYTSDFTPPTESLTAVSGTSLLACHLPYFGDGSTNNHTITVNGNTSTKPFGPYDYEVWTGDDHGGTLYLDGASNITSATNLTTVVGNYTVEFWLRPWDNLTDQQTILHFNSGSNGGTNIWYGGASGSNIRVDNGTVGTTSFTGESLVLNAWNHVAITRSSTTTTCYINGISAGSHTYTPAASNRLVVGRYGSTAYYCKAHIADLRYVPGSVVYTTNFTPPTAPLGHITNTDLLMNNKSDANVYDASAGDTLKITGNTASSTTKRKFTTSSSVYFDGTGDQIDGTQSIDLAAGDFTIEFWWNHTTTPSSGDAIVSLRIDGSVYDSFLFYGAPSNRWQTYASTNGTSWNLITSYTTIEGPNNDQWYHYAITREGATIRIYLDGVYLGNWNVGTTAFMPSKLRVGYYNTQHWDGYVQDLRISKYARYTGPTNFTPPTAEFDL